MLKFFNQSYYKIIEFSLKKSENEALQINFLSLKPY